MLWFLLGTGARAVPAQKLLLVQTLQNSGEIVAVTGDGIHVLRGTSSACHSCWCRTCAGRIPAPRTAAC
ncbi:MAG: hypothetical protein JNL77_08635 [Nitrosomonas sp.]|nr:hypothetical protein [Nitrosomonas sp.]